MTTTAAKRGEAQLALAPPAAGPAPMADAVAAQKPPAPVGPQGAPAAPAGVELPAERKIVFTGVIEVEVKDFAAARTELFALLQRHKGYFSKTEVTGDSGKKRSGTFTIKVPVEQFQPLADALVALGNPVRNGTDSQDVTEEFVDVTARVKNLKAEEEVFNRLLKDAAGRLEDVFRIREQIRQVRGEIERNEARVQALGKMAALSTITLTLREIEPYVAPTAPKPSDPPPPPPFEDRASDIFGRSVANVRAFGEAIALFAIGIAPWLPVVAVVVVLAYFGLRAAARIPAAPPAVRPPRYAPAVARPIPPSTPEGGPRSDDGPVG